MSLREKLKKIKWLKKIYYKYKFRKQLFDKHTFINRSNGSNRLCYIISGYKEFAWDIVFERIYKFIPKDIDVCIISGGLYNQKLYDYAEKYNWSYLYSKTNNVGLVQNLVINKFEKAEYIFKLDEDIFVTENYFTNLWNCYNSLQEDGLYKPGIVAPMININGFSHYEVLKRFDQISTYTSKFERPYYMAGSHRMIENNPDVAKFMWGEGSFLPSIDEMNKIVNKDHKDYIACPIRFSIGAILFSKQIWKDMGFFRVTSKKLIDLGLDESQICDFCIENSQAIIVCKNSIVGHLSFGKQNELMKEYFLNNKEKFQIKS